MPVGKSTKGFLLRHGSKRTTRIADRPIVKPAFSGGIEIEMLSNSDKTRYRMVLGREEIAQLKELI